MIRANTRYNLPTILIVLSWLCTASPAWPAALWLYENGSPDLGTAAAGRAALAADASTAGGNPAGMARLDRSQAMLGLVGMVFKAEFDPDNDPTFGGGDGGDAGDFIPGGGLFYVHSLTPKFKLGIMAGSYFGLGVDYDDDWMGRYYVQDADLITYGVNPVVAYRVNDWLSLGGGVGVLVGDLEQKAAVNNAAVEGDPDFPDGKIKLEDDDVGYNFNLGVLIELAKGTRFGITYRSEVDLEFEDVAQLKGLGPTLSAALDLLGARGTKVDLDFTVPQAVMLSGYHEVTERWAVMANVGWQQWSEFGKTEVTVRSQTTRKFTQDRGYDDAWHFAVGTQYRFGDPWLASVGFAYDTDPVDGAENNTPDLALDRQIRYAAGLQYDWNEDVTVGAAYEYLDLGDAEIKQDGALSGTLEGDYDPNHIHVIALNINWKF